jgi:hypothetical protein
MMRQKHALIGLRTGVRLHVRKLAPEELFRPFDRQLFHHVHELAAAVISAPGVAFGVLVGEYRALRLHRSQRHDVLGCDELDLVLLPVREFRIRLAQCGGEKAVRHWSAPSRLVKTAKLIAGRMRQINISLGCRPATAQPKAMVIGLRGHGVRGQSSFGGNRRSGHVELRPRCW